MINMTRCQMVAISIRSLWWRGFDICLYRKVSKLGMSNYECNWKSSSVNRGYVQVSDADYKNSIDTGGKVDVRKTFVKKIHS